MNINDKNMITNEEYKELQNFKTAFNYALKSNCVPAFTKDELDTMERIYNELGKSLDNRRCGHCILTMVQILGTEFYNYEQESNRKRNRCKKTKESKAECEVGSEEANNLK